MDPVSHNHPASGGSASTILVISASEAMRVALEISLTLAGYRVATVGDPEEGLRAVASARPELVVLQTEWPNERAKGETSLALLRALRAADSSLPWLVLAHHEYKMCEELLDGGDVEHLGIPWNEQRFLSSVTYLIGRRKPTGHDGVDPSDAEIEQALLQSRGALSRAARHLGLTLAALGQRMKSLRDTTECEGKSEGDW